jgi:ABC-2 type transport system ATP-binding protein
MSAGIVVRGLVRRYGSTTAVDGVDLDAAPGRITGLLGRNGAGKTTTLECLLGLRRPDAGSITVDGIDALANIAMAKRRLGAQLQTTALQDQITPREALRFFGSFYRTPLAADDLLKRFDLTDKASARFDTLSTGQRQRLGLALAIVNDPPVLVMDEPTAGLDPHARRQLHELIAGVRDAGRTVLLSTHDVAEAGRLCDHVVIVSHGRVIAAGRPADLCASGAPATSVVIRTATPLPPDAVRSMAVTRADPLPDGWRLATTNVARCLADVAAAAAAASIEVTDVTIQRPSLEDAFLRLTDQP